MTSITKKFIDISQCVKCKEGSLIPDREYYICSNCNEKFAIDQSIPQIIDKSTMKLPKFYEDKEFIKYCDNWTQVENFLYRENSLISFVQNAGHRHVTNLRRKREYDIVLDLACGDGAHAPFIENFDNYIGVDIDLPSLKQLKSRYNNAFVFRGDVTSLPFKDNSIPCIVNVYNLEHMVHLDFILEEMVRVLASGGDCFVSIPGEGGLAWVLGRHFTSMKKFTKMGIDYGRIIKFIHVNCVWQVQRVLKRYFAVKKRIFFPFRFPSFHFNLVVTYHLVSLE